LYLDDFFIGSKILKNVLDDKSMLENVLFKMNLSFNLQKTSIILQGSLNSVDNRLLLRKIFNKFCVPINEGFEVLKNDIRKRWLDPEYTPSKRRRYSE
jgi:hypothetical protein